jgi:small subunit ribosomal protein S1
VKTKVLSVVDYGVFVKVRDGIEGLISQNDVVTPVDAEGKEKPLRPGDEVDAEIANIDTQERRITLSMRMGEAAPQASSGEASAKPARAQTKAPKKSAAAEAAGGTIGDLIKQKLGGKLTNIGPEKGEKKEDDKDGAKDGEETE